MERVEIIKEYMDIIVFTTSSREKGGQTCGKVDPTVTASIDDLNISIKVGCFRSQYYNKQHAKLLIECTLCELFK